MNERASHTPGPWSDLRVGRDYKTGTERSYEAQICNVGGVGVFIVTHDGSAEGKANVSLASEAPVLLDALTRLIAALPKCRGTEGTGLPPVVCSKPAQFTDRCCRDHSHAASRELSTRAPVDRAIELLERIGGAK